MWMKLQFLSLIPYLFTEANENYETNYDVARGSKDIRFIYQLTAPSSHTPPGPGTGLYKESNVVTPLGIR